jgi:hypothetical protein
LLVYLDAANLREQEEFANRIESGRLGYLFARNRKAHDRWRRSQDRLTTRPAPLSEVALMAQLNRAAAMFPGNVIHEAR